MLEVLFIDGSEKKLNGTVIYDYNNYVIEVEGFEDRDYSQFKLIWDTVSNNVVKFNVRSFGFHSAREYGRLYQQSQLELKQAELFKEMIDDWEEHLDFNDKEELAQWLVFESDRISNIVNLKTK